MNAKLGYYKVGNQIFYNKLKAILYANPTKENVTWHFNNEIFDNCNWLVEPPISLNRLYAERAKQIREQYDYIVIMVSGGADSTNVLYSFLNNNVHIDEIVASAPVSGMSNWKIDVTDKSVENTISETMLAQLPLLDKISKSHPNIKLTLNDYFNDIVNFKTDEWIYNAASHWIHFSGAVRHSLDNLKHLRELAESGKRIGVVYGIDKPIICRGVSGNLYSVIADPVVNIVCPHFKDKYPNVETVLFYYSPDLPELLIKQAHEVCRWIYKPENKNIKALLWDRSKPVEFNVNPERGGLYQRGIVPCIYPDIQERHGIWQAMKQGMGFKGGFHMDGWIFKLYNQERFVQLVQSDLKLLVKNIDKKYLASEDKNDGFIRFYHYWKIGHEKDFSPTQIINLNIDTYINEKEIII